MTNFKLSILTHHVFTYPKSAFYHTNQNMRTQRALGYRKTYTHFRVKSVVNFNHGKHDVQKMGPNAKKIMYVLKSAQHPQNLCFAKRIKEEGADQECCLINWLRPSLRQVHHESTDERLARMGIGKKKHAKSCKWLGIKFNPLMWAK